MTPAQIEWALKLGACTFVPGTSVKRIAKSLAAIAKDNPSKVLSLKQSLFLELMVFRYRRQTGYKGSEPPDLGREVNDPNLGLIDLRNVGAQ